MKANIEAIRTLIDQASPGLICMFDVIRAARIALAEVEAHLASLEAAPKVETDALRAIMRLADKAKEPCGMDPESPAAIRNGKFATIAHVAAQGLGMVMGPSLAAPASAGVEEFPLPELPKPHNEAIRTCGVDGFTAEQYREGQRAALRSYSASLGLQARTEGKV